MERMRLTTGSPGNKDETNTVTLGDTFTVNTNSVNAFPCDVQPARGQSADPLPICSVRTVLVIQGFQGEHAQRLYADHRQRTTSNVACGTCAPGYFNINNYQLSGRLFAQARASISSPSVSISGRSSSFRSTTSRRTGSGRSAVPHRVTRWRTSGSGKTRAV